MHDDTQRAPTKKRRPPQLEAPGQQASKEGVRIDPACSVLAVQGHVHATHGRFLASLRRQKDQRRSDARRRSARGPYTIRSSMSLPVFFYFGFFPATSCTGAWAVCELGSTTHPPGRLTRRSRRKPTSNSERHHRTTATPSHLAEGKKQLGVVLEFGPHLSIFNRGILLFGYLSSPC